LVPTELEKLNGFLAAQANESSRVSGLKALVDQKLSELRQTISLRQDRGIARALDVVLSNEGKRTMDAIRDLCAEIRGSENVLENQASLDREAAARVTLLATFAGA